MNYSTRAVSLLAAAAAALCLSSGAMAQDQASSPPAAGMAHHGPDREARMKAHEERRAQFLHDVLNIRPDQEPALQAFLADMRPPAHEHKDWAERKDEAGQKAPLTTPERLDRMAAFMAKRTAERQAAFQHRVEAIKRFYAVLSPEQKRAFDALHERGGMGRGQRGFGHHPGGPGGPGENPGGAPEHEREGAGEAG